MYNIIYSFFRPILTWTLLLYTAFIDSCLPDTSLLFYFPYTFVLCISCFMWFLLFMPFCKVLYKRFFYINGALTFSASWHCFVPAGLWFSPVLFFSLSFFLLLIPSDILTCKQTQYHLSTKGFFFCNTIWCVSQTTKGNGGREGEGGGRGWEAGLRCGISDSPALSLLSALRVGEKHPTFFIIIKHW